eukprot:746762-Hanusia_phi.AAC.7
MQAAQRTKKSDRMSVMSTILEETRKLTSSSESSSPLNQDLGFSSDEMNSYMLGTISGMISLESTPMKQLSSENSDHVEATFTMEVARRRILDLAQKVGLYLFSYLMSGNGNREMKSLLLDILKAASRDGIERDEKGDSNTFDFSGEESSSDQEGSHDDLNFDFDKFTSSTSEFRSHTNSEDEIESGMLCSTPESIKYLIPTSSIKVQNALNCCSSPHSSSEIWGALQKSGKNSVMCELDCQRNSGTGHSNADCVSEFIANLGAIFPELLESYRSPQSLDNQIDTGIDAGEDMTVDEMEAESEEKRESSDMSLCSTSAQTPNKSANHCSTYESPNETLQFPSVENSREDERGNGSLDIAQELVDETNARIMESLSRAKSGLCKSEKQESLNCPAGKQNRRSSRKRMRPLQFWRHERIEYKRKTGSAVPEMACIFVLTPNSKKRG